LRGIDAIFETQTRSVSYTIVNGQVQYVGEGVIYDSRYKNQMLTKELLDSELFSSNNSTTPRSIKFHLIPNEGFYHTYYTSNAIRATLVVVFSVLGTMLIFFLYDFSVRKEFHANGELLEARRQFMRFVSHEVRTPLNAVIMGLDIIQFEIAKSLGFESHTAYRASPEFEAEAHRNDLSISSRCSSVNDLTALIEDDSATGTGIISREVARSWFRVTQEIQDNSQGAVDILNDLLNYDKIEQGKLQLVLEVLSIWDLLEQAILEFKLPASSKDLKLGLSFQIFQGSENSKIKRARDLPKEIDSLKVIGDSIRLTQVLRNLMSNALKFTPSNGSVHVKGSFVPLQTSESSLVESVQLDNGDKVTGTREGSILVEVIDDGAGMTAEQLQNLFQDGVQFNVNHLQAGHGSGLGLYIAKGIVEQHGGLLSARSNGIRQGTTFKMTLPLWKIVSEESTVDIGEEVSRSSQRRTSTVSSGMPLRILVVDDVKSNRKLLRRLLENNGFQCKEAENGEEALNLMGQAVDEGEPFDSVLLDSEMPVMNGPSTVKQIRQDPRFESVNVVGITGNVLPKDVQEFVNCGVNDVLGKPIKISDLFSSWMEAGFCVKGDDT
jgi:signal transduction histidine kinase/CheY-like chemotaxis protein